jgi:serine phosphatase RsbU (regulator of sigma subunit)
MLSTACCGNVSLPPFDPMRLPFQNRVEEPTLRKPAPCVPPHLATSDLAALYRAARVGGDFFEFVQVGNDRLIFILLDIAGRRDQALHIAAAVQDTLRSLALEFFTATDLNECDAVTELSLRLNQTIIAAAGGVRCAPGFVGCYNESLSMLTYINAGSVPALVKDEKGISVLEASGLPLGLFSHGTHDAQICVLPLGSALLLASRGLLEVRAGGEEYGFARLRDSFEQVAVENANQLCAAVLRNVSEFVEQNRRRRFLGLVGVQQGEKDSLGENDITTVALVRSAARSGAVASAR